MRIRSAAVAAASPRRLNIKEQALWTLQRLFPDSGVSNEALVFAVPGRIDEALLRTQLVRLVTRHALLRTVFPELHGEPAEVVMAPGDVRVDIQVFEQTREITVTDEVADFVARPFDLTGETPLRVGLWRTDERDVCCLALHHLAYDAWSAAVLFDDLVAGYNVASDGAHTPDRLTDPVPRTVEPMADPADLAYWREQVRGLDPQRQRLALGRPDPEVPRFAGAARVHTLSAGARAAAAALAGQHRATEHIVLLAVYYLLLARHGAGSEVSVGVSVDVRDPSVRPGVGYHVNTLPIRTKVSDVDSFGALVVTVRQTLLAGMTHRAVPYEAVLPDLSTTGSAWRTPLFRYMFNYLSASLPDTARLAGMPVELLSVTTRHSRQDLEFRVENGPDTGRIRAVYSTEIFDDVDVRALQERYDALLVALAGHGERPLTDVDWWTAADHATIARANGTTDTTPTPPVLTRVLDNAARTPRAPAVVDGATVYDYAELGAAAKDVRDRLVAAGVGSGGVVALYARRGAELAAATLGVWAAGAAYLPLHPEHPADLLTFQLEDSGAVALLADGPLPAGVAVACPVLPLTEPSTVPPARLEVNVAPDSTAYVIYTSGSTGRPKGVRLTHDNLANLIADFHQRLGVGPEDAVLWLTTFAFDISALEVFLPLVAGGRVVVAPDTAHGDPELLLDLVRRNDVRVLQATPTTWSAVAQRADGALAGRIVLCGGEPLTAALAEQLIATDCRLWNVYGPTETTIWSTVAEIDELPVSIGIPLRNTVAFVAGPDGRARPPGVAGELCIAGRGVALGYAGRPELTEDRFRTAPGIGRYYRTGDRARWRHDGRLDLLGRADRQVKIRAHRIELGEIEAVLAQHPGVVLAAAVLRDDLPVDSSLTVFVQPTGAVAAGFVDELWAYARQKLAGYALPSRIVPGPVPTTGNGKIDYRALRRRPLPATVVAREDRPVPESGRVAEVVELWRELLEDPGLGPDDNFFLCGGHSMLAARMLARIGSSTGITLTLSTLLDAPTAGELAEHLQRVTS